MKIVVFSGAGISQESGLQTFRGENGLWNGFKIEDVCSARAWKTDPEQVLNFYNERRKEVRKVEPNAAHYAIAELGNDLDVEMIVVTQNIDDLHERAGSQHVLHLHGELMKKRSDRTSVDGALVDCIDDIHIGDKAPDGGQYRQHVVMFQEDLPIKILREAIAASVAADVLIVVGTTLQVSPANYVVFDTKAPLIIMVDPDPPYLRWDEPQKKIEIAKTATEGIPEAIALVRERMAARD